MTSRENLDDDGTITLRLSGLSELVAVPLFLYWLHVSLNNLRALSVSGTTSSKIWPIACWFIPIVHLFAPLDVMVQLWKGSHPRTAPGEHLDQVEPPIIAHLVVLWWIARLACQTTQQARLYGVFPDDMEWATLAIIELGIAVGLLITHPMYLLIVWRICKWQNEKYDRWIAGGAVSPATE